MSEIEAPPPIPTSEPSTTANKRDSSVSASGDKPTEPMDFTPKKDQDEEFGGSSSDYEKIANILKNYNNQRTTISDKQKQDKANLFDNIIYTTTHPINNEPKRCVFVFGPKHAATYFHGKLHSTFIVGEYTIIYSMKTKAGAMVQIIRTNKEADVVIFEWVAGKKFEVQELECGTFELGERYTSFGILGNIFAAGHGSMRRFTGSHYIGDGESEKGDSGSPVLPNFPFFSFIKLMT
uniref:Uncharacterized protein n=1 Tax=Panagrolaimus davidi TaxID=227884 RepID=A0A914QAJ1_9BILA